MKKTLCALLVFMLVLSMGTSAYAIIAPEDSVKSLESNTITIEECYLAGEKWIRANYDYETTISNVVPIHDLNNQLVSYCINFSKDDLPNGYLVLSASKTSRSFIQEFALDGAGIYEQLIENGGIKNAKETIIYAVSPFEYALKYEDNGETLFYNSNNSIMTLLQEKEHYEGAFTLNNENPLCSDEEGNATEDEVYYDAFFYGTSLDSYIERNDCVITGADEFVPYKMSTLRDGKNQDNCGPTVAANICALNYYNGKLNMLINGNINTTYSTLVGKVGFERNGSGGTLYSNLVAGLEDYIEGRRYTANIGTTLISTWTSFKTWYQTNKCAIVFMEGNKIVNGETVTVGHFVVGVGYREMNDGSRYMRVYDCWNASNNRFVNFDADSIVTFKGSYVQVS